MPNDTNTPDDNDFDHIPDMPSAESVREKLVATMGPEHWNPFGAGERPPVNFGDLPEKTAQNLLKARMEAGPGPNGSKAQHALWEHWKKEAKLESERSRIHNDLDAVNGYDPVTGKGIPAIQSPQKRKAMHYRLLTIEEDLERHLGEPGKKRLEKAIDAAVHAERVSIKQNYMLAEAKRRAKAEADEAEINRLKDGFSKTLPSK